MTGLLAALSCLGGLGVIGLVIASLLYLVDVPARSDRLRIELEAQRAAWRIQQHTRAAVQQLLDEARDQRQQ